MTSAKQTNRKELKRLDRRDISHGFGFTLHGFLGNGAATDAG